MHRFTAHAVKVLSKLMHPDGFNLGMNLGKPAGAGVAGHLHCYIVPRWTGDCNFMPVLSETRVVSEAIDDTYRRLRTVWNEEMMV